VFLPRVVSRVFCVVCSCFCGLPKNIKQLIYIPSILKICALNHHGLFGKGTSFLHMIFIVFSGALLVPVTANGRYTTHLCLKEGIYIIYIYNYIYNHIFIYIYVGSFQTGLTHPPTQPSAQAWSGS
jgi:hypothetical protein